MYKRLYSDPTRFMNIKEGVLKGLTIAPPPKVDKPTYEVVGPIEPWDWRGNVIARKTLLRPDTPEFEEYYSRYPEKKAGDEDRRKRAMKSAMKLVEENLVNEKISASGFRGARLLSHPNILNAPAVKHVGEGGVDEVEVGKVDVDPVKMACKIKALALYLGAAKVGITELNQTWVSGRRTGPMGDPIEMDYKYVICMAFLEDPFMQNDQIGLGHHLEVGFKYAVSSLVTNIIAQLIRNLGWRARPLTPMSMHYLVVPTFIDAGIGEQGRMGIVVTKEFGNAFRPGAVATDLPLTIDKPVDFGLQDFCQKCQICADTCPPKAITKGDRVVMNGTRRWKVDEEKCYTYWLTMGHPCGICQVVCPWNHPNNLWHNSVREVGQRFTRLRSILISGDKFFYKHKPGPTPKWLTEQI